MILQALQVKGANLQAVDNRLPRRSVLHAIPVFILIHHDKPIARFVICPALDSCRVDVNGIAGENVRVAGIATSF